MANNVHRYGFRPVKPWMGTQVPEPIEMPVADAYQGQADDDATSVDLNIGDPVKLVNDGTVALAQSTEDVWGVIVGFKPYWNGAAMTPTNRLPGATTGGGLLTRKSRVLVVPVLAYIWECDVDENTTATTEAGYLAYVGENVDHTCAGDTTNSNRPKADPRLDISGHAPTHTLGWRIVGVSKSAENADFSGTNVKLWVVCNNVQVYDATDHHNTGV